MDRTKEAVLHEVMGLDLWNPDELPCELAFGQGATVTTGVVLICSRAVAAPVWEWIQRMCVTLGSEDLREIRKTQRPTIAHIDTQPRYLFLFRPPMLRLASNCYDVYER